MPNLFSIVWGKVKVLILYHDSFGLFTYSQRNGLGSIEWRSFAGLVCLSSALNNTFHSLFQVMI